MSSKLIDLINHYDKILDRAGIEAPRRNIERLLENILGLKRIDLYLNPNLEIKPDDQKHLSALIERRLQYEPLQYILGETEFYGLPFKADKRALIPRPETEFVVSAGLEWLKTGSEMNVLDLACGSGNIVVSLAVNAPAHNYYATDLFYGAVELAEENAELNRMSSKISFYQGNLFEPFKSMNIKFDLICANPPYIKTGEYDQIHEQVKKYEPTEALFSGVDGLAFIREMLTQAPEYMSRKSQLIFEIAMGQVEDIKALLAGQNFLKLVRTVRDYNDIERVIVLENIA